MIDEAAAMVGCVLPRFAVAQVAEDLARPVDEAAVLGLERRDLVLPREVAQVLAVLRPRFDLPRDEVDPELGQDLAHRGGERAPLGLIERQHDQPSKPFVLCVPSQKGLFCEPPQRHSAVFSPS